MSEINEQRPTPEFNQGPTNESVIPTEEPTRTPGSAESGALEDEQEGVEEPGRTPGSAETGELDDTDDMNVRKE